MIRSRILSMEFAGRMSDTTDPERTVEAQLIENQDVQGIIYDQNRDLIDVTRG